MVNNKITTIKETLLKLTINFIIITKDQTAIRTVLQPVHLYAINQTVKKYIWAKNHINRRKWKRINHITQKEHISNATKLKQTQT